MSELIQRSAGYTSVPQLLLVAAAAQQRGSEAASGRSLSLAAPAASQPGTARAANVYHMSGTHDGLQTGWDMCGC